MRSGGRSRGPPYDGRPWRPGTVRRVPSTASGALVRRNPADSHWVRWHQPYDDPALEPLAAVADRAIHGARRARRRARVPCGADPDREPVRRPGSRRDRRRVDPSTGPGGLGAAGRARPGPGRPSPGTVPRRPAWPTGCGWSRATRRSPAGTRTMCPPIWCWCAASSGTSAAPTSRPPSRRCGGSAGPVAISSGPGTAARPTPPLPSGPTWRPRGSAEVAFVAPEGTVMTVGHHRLDGPTRPFDPDRVLFDFVGDGFAPA